MFEFLHEIMSDAAQNPSAPNVFFPTMPETIAKAEGRLGFRFPEQLRTFYAEIGTGFLKSASNSGSNRDFHYANRILSPKEVADLYLGEADHLLPSEGIGDDALPFFEVGSGLYIVLSPGSSTAPKVCWPFGKEITESVLSFFEKLAKNPRFYHSK